ncbi:hypothetical protein HanRHA438_Chr02g0048121 [Helianthus annuus]|nr:hypothetical protein HanRHA438_Chr02g0048121 [Helianthus annuus]
MKQLLNDLLHASAIQLFGELILCLTFSIGGILGVLQMWTKGVPRRIHVHGGGFFDYAERSYEPNWAYQGTMQKFIENQRPPSFVFDTWSGSEWTFFYHQTWMGSSMERALKHSFDRQESWNRTHAYAFE